MQAMKEQQGSIPVVLIRHAQSQWNLENRFTGWANPPLTQAGEAEARRAGAALRQAGYRFDTAFSSRLQRAQSTLDILLAELGQTQIVRHRDWRLNERHYGALQGMDKAAAAASFGDRQVWRWRRGYADRVAPLNRDDPRHPIYDSGYADLPPDLLPAGESLADTRGRVTAFWNESMVPRIQAGERVLISAHGNTLRALIMELSGMGVEDVEAFEIPTATPIHYRFDAGARPLAWHYVGQQGT
jgi:2,3-bisphosphoglycerate-dependent phosphoglycerate mutase